MRGKRATGRRGLDAYDASRDASPQARAERAYARKDLPPSLPVIAGPGCWCGARFGHDWPGKAQGRPHPRDWPGRVNGHPYRGG